MVVIFAVLTLFNLMTNQEQITNNFKDVFIKLFSCPISCQTFLNAREQNDYDTNITYVHAMKTMKFGDIKVHFPCIFHDN